MAAFEGVDQCLEMADMGAKPSAPGGAERLLRRSRNGPAYDQLESI
jgi:hypothetical protein